MTIHVICPAPARSRSGNRVTAIRWASILRGLGHRVKILQAYKAGRCDLLIALHARKSAASIARYRALNPGKPLVVALTGTDLYHDLRTSREAQRSIEAATRLVALQPAAFAELPRHLRKKMRIIYQSAPPSRAPVKRSERTFDIAVVGHLRQEKDPFRTELAVRNLPPRSRIRVLHAGAALDKNLGARAASLSRQNSRYVWLAGLPHGRSRKLIARCRLLALTSRIEGGANVISEAIASGTPVVASRIASSEGILGSDYPGFFPVGGTHALRKLLLRAEQDLHYLNQLRARCLKLQPLFDPGRERSSWKELLAELRREDSTARGSKR